MSQIYTVDCFDKDNIVQTDMEHIEENFAALKSAFSGATEPLVAIRSSGMWWLDTTAHILKQRNEANTAWLSVWDMANNKPVITNLSNEITGAMIVAAIKDPAADTAGLRTLGIGAVQACAGNDSRLTIGGLAIFISSGSFTAKTVLTFIEMWAGGGGGAGGDASGAGGGGAGGGYIRLAVTTVVGTVYNIVIGAKGVGTTGAVDGTAGGSSSFGALVSCGGGEGGKYDSAVASVGGSFPDFPGLKGNNGIVGGTAPGDAGGYGADGLLGSGEKGAPGAAWNNGEDATGYSSGGGGAGSEASGVGTNKGGDGTPGYARITW